jgi:hypothetical protein
MEAITVIMMLCNIRVMEIDKYTKRECIDYYTNCLIVEDGRFAAEKVETCKKQYKGTVKVVK